MTPSQIASDVMALGGLMVLGVCLQKLMRKKVVVAAANEQILKLAAADNLERALKLCRAVSGTYLDAIAAAITAGLAVQPPSESAVLGAVHTAFDQAGATLVARSRTWVTRGLVGTLLVGGALGVAGLDAIPRPLLGAAGAGVIATFALLTQGAYMRGALASARHQVLPSLIGVIVDRAV